MEHGFSLDTGEAHLMFPAKPGNGAGKEGRIGGRPATRLGAVRPLSFRSGSREDARFCPALLVGAHFAQESSVRRGLG